MNQPLHERLKAVLAAHRLPGVAAIIFDKDQIIDQAVVGVRQMGKSTPLTLSDHFHIGSNGKAMTGTIIAQLVENGRLRWNSTLPEILPDWARQMHPEYHAVTLRQLLTHQAGLPPFEEDVEFAPLPPMTGTPLEQRRRFAQYVLGKSPIHLPGTEFRYSNAGFAIGTVMAEAVSGEAWESMLLTRLLQPLDIPGGVGWPAQTDPAQPWGHALENDQLVPHDPNGEYQLEPFIAPAGDVHVAFDAYPKFLQMHLRGLAGEQTLLKPESVQFLHEPNGRSGIGWGIQPLEGHTVSVHTGSADTFFAIALLVPSQQLGMAIIANATWEVAERPLIDLLKELMKKYCPPS